MSRPKGAVRWGIGTMSSSRDGIRRISPDLNGNRAQRREAKRLGVTAAHQCDACHGDAQTDNQSTEGDAT